MLGVKTFCTVTMICVSAELNMTWPNAVSATGKGGVVTFRFKRRSVLGAGKRPVEGFCLKQLVGVTVIKTFA